MGTKVQIQRFLKLGDCLYIESITNRLEISSKVLSTPLSIEGLFLIIN